MDVTKLVIIQFVGLCVITTQLEQDPGLRAILPRVGSGRGGGVVAANDKSHQASMARQAAPATTTPTSTAAGVETHAAIIAFQTDVISSSGWTVADLPSAPGYKYIRLDGERITFEVRNATGPDRADDTRSTALAASNRITSSRIASSDLPALPHLGQCCPKMGRLRDSFKPPYNGAAAIVAFDEGTIARACRANATAVDSRRDTQVRLINAGSSITIRGVKGTVVKTLVLKTPDDLGLFIGNVPEAWVLFAHDDYESQGMPHYQAYYAMGQQDGSDPTCNPITQCIPVGSLGPCEYSPVITPGAPAPKVIKAPKIFRISSSECSNSLWP